MRYILQELFTAEGADPTTSSVVPRSTETSAKGEAAIEPGVPESFNVLLRELQSLCLDLELIKQADQKIMPLPSVAAAD